MPRHNQAFKVALAAAQQLPPKLQRQLVEQFIMTTPPDDQSPELFDERGKLVKRRYSDRDG